ncbi:MAG: hypothetical protein LBQ15_00255 [Clostridium sp.]|nr:hypothetical protein [Clostridium sp.]
MNCLWLAAKLRLKEWRERAGVFLKRNMLSKSQGIDGILVTVGLCIIALLLCVVMKEQLTNLIRDVVGQMGEKAKNILDSDVA